MSGGFDQLNVIGSVDFEDAMELVARGATATPAEYLENGWPYTLEQTKKLIKRDRRYSYNAGRWAEALAESPELLVPIMLPDSRSTVRWACVLQIFNNPELFGLETVAEALAVDVGQRAVEERDGFVAALILRYGEDLLQACDSHTYWDQRTVAEEPESLREYITAGNRFMSETFLERLIRWHRTQGAAWRELVELPEAGDEVPGYAAYDMLSGGCATLEDIFSLITEMYGYHWGASKLQSIDFDHSIEYNVAWTVEQVTKRGSLVKPFEDPIGDLKNFFYSVRDFLQDVNEPYLVEKFQAGLTRVLSNRRLSPADMASIPGDMTWLALGGSDYDPHHALQDAIVSAMCSNLSESAEHKQSLLDMYESLALKRARISQARAIQLIQETDGEVEFPIIPTHPVDFAVQGALGILPGVTSEQFFASGYTERIASVLNRCSGGGEYTLQPHTAMRLNEVISTDP